MSENASQCGSSGPSESTKSDPKPTTARSSAPAASTPAPKSPNLHSGAPVYTTCSNSPAASTAAPTNTSKAESSPTITPQARVDRWIRDEAPVWFAVDAFTDTLSDNTYFDALSIDDFFVEMLTVQGVQMPMLYLHGVYTRALGAKRTIPAKDPVHAAKTDTLNAVVRLCASYGVICLQEPDIFVNNDVSAIVQLLIDRQETHMFLADVVAQADAQEALLEVLDALVPSLVAQMAPLNLDKPEYAKYLVLWELLAAMKPFCAHFSQIAGFFPRDRQHALAYESETLLGLFLKLSPLAPASARAYFLRDAHMNSEVELSQGELAPRFASVRSEYKAVLERICFVVDKLIRGGARTRRDMMRWFADLVNASHLRTGSYSDPRKQASDELMFNITHVFVRLSVPFLQYPSYTKLDRIDPHYFGALNTLLDVTDEARVYASPTEAVSHYADAIAQDTNFITECFYVALAYLHYGLGGVIVNHKKLKKQQERYREMLEAHLARPGVTSGNPIVSTVCHALNTAKSCWWATAALALDPAVNEDIFVFVVGCTYVFTRMIDPAHKHPAPRLQIPLFEVASVSQLDEHEFLKAQAPAPWKFLPEFCVEGVVNYCRFLFDFQYNWFLPTDARVGDVAQFLVMLLRCPELVGNPHLKASIVEIWFLGTLDSAGRPGMFHRLLDDDPVVRQNLLYSLLDVYVTVEKTGASSQFYDKFNSRYYISSVIEQLWQTEFYKAQLSSYARTKTDFFVRFVARMLNDTTYLFDESFNELNSIHTMQVELQNRDAGNAHDDTLGTTEELQRELAAVERRAKSEMGLAKQTMKLFKLFTKQAPEGFTIAELADRLAGMLDYNLSLMVGPKCSGLKVKEPEKYGFDAKEMLADIVLVYCNLRAQDKFVDAVARDGRSFNVSLFVRARDILINRTNTPPDVISAFYEFGQAAEQRRLLLEQEEKDLGDVPDELLDPLMYTLMEDPVILPGSRVTIDRSTIKAHLLSDATDPFNRMPLRLEDVIDDVEMRQKIQDFKRRGRDS